MRVIIYGRSNRRGISADTQIEKLKSLCQDRAYEVIGEIRDCCSGSQVGDNLSKLLNERVLDYDAIVIRDPSRISRDLVRMLEIVKKMRGMGIKLICADVEEMDISAGRKEILKIS